MPSDSPEPENYTISEMMDRLKERSSGDPSSGELVTRADGSQAIKVRKRKRRSEQVERDSQKRAKRLRAIQLVVVLMLFLSFLLVAGGAMIHYNGSSYRNKVVERIGTATGATAEVSQFRVTPLRVNASSVTLNWPEHSIVKSLSLNRVSSELHVSSLLGQTFSGDEMTAENGELILNEATAAGGAILGDEPSRRFQFSRFRSPDMTVVLGDVRNPAVTVKQTEISFYPMSVNGRAELRLNKGSVGFGAGFPALNLDRGFFAFSGRQMEVLNLRLENPADARGVIELAGTINPFTKGRTSTLDIKKVENFPLEHLVGQEFGRILSGRIESRDLPNSNFLTFSPGSMESARLMMAFRGGFSSKLTLSNLPFLNVLARMLDDSGYQRPSLDSGASGVLRMSSSGYSVEELRLEAKSRLMIRGSLAVTNGKQLKGKLELGLPANQVSTFLRAIDADFSALREEMRWIDIEVSGTTTAPEDDFGNRLISKTTRPANGANPSGATPKSQFEEATKPR
jgi:hypothetical protein